MNLLSATDFFSKIFEWFASLSSKLPAIDYKTYFIVVVALLIGIGVIVALTFFGSYRYKLLRACKKIIRYLSSVDAIDNDNFGDFTAQCFSAKAPSALRDCWVQYLGVRFGYPSDIVSEQNVYDKEVKRVREIRANVYIAIALILIAVFSFWGYGRLDGNDMGVIFLASLLLSGVIYLVLVILNRMLSTKCLYVFNNMQEDLDAKVVFQVEKSFATDSSPLADLSAIIDEIVARNTAKDIGFEFADEQTPIEELIAKTSQADNAEDDAENKAENDAEKAKAGSVEDVIAQAEEFVKEDINEEKAESVEPVLEGIVDESEPQVEKTVEETADGSSDIVEDTAIETEAATQDEPVEAVGDVIDKEEEASAQETPVIEAESAKVPEADVIASEAVQIEEDGAGKEEIASEKETSEENSKKEPADEIAEEEPASENIAETKMAEEEENTAEAHVDEQPKVSYVSEEEPDSQKKSIESESDEELSDEDDPEQNSDSNAEQTPKQNEEEDAKEDPLEPVVRYVVDGPGEDDEFVRPAKLVKMPNLVDYVIAQNMSNKVKMNLATMLMSTYKKFESSDEDKKIIKECVRKLMANLQNNK